MKTIKRITAYFCVVLLLFSCNNSKETDNSQTATQEIVSPNENIKIEVSLKSNSDNSSDSNQVYFRVLYKVNAEYVEILPQSPLGIVREDQLFTNNLKFVGASEVKAIHDQYEMIGGKKKLCENFGTEKTLQYVNSNNQPLHITFRAYNDGVVFRYEFTNSSDSLVNIIDEATSYVFPDSTSRWVMPFEASYENFFPFSKTGIGEQKEQEWGFPALFKANNSPVWILISEANIGKENCATRLSNLENNNVYKITYPPQRDNFKQIGVKTQLPWKSQWHTLIIGSLSDLVASTLISDVSEPNKLTAPDWIQPGAAAWVYWAYNHGSKDYKKVIEYVDLAVEMKWDYVLIDWEWDVMENGGNLVDAVNYAKSKGIKPLIWYNSGTSWLEPTPNDRITTKEKRAKEFAWLNEIGIYGIKVDFFAGDQQDVMQLYIDLLEEAAQYNLMVNFHGSSTPRGWSRTYPNLMTTEAVYGAEWYNNKPILTDKAAAHNATLPFTRNIIGSMDYTPVTFSHSQHPHITSYAHELALSVIFESAIQHFADRPEAYNSLPEAPKAFLQTVPVTWDDTKLIDGYPAERVVMARKKDSKWYIAGLNGKDDAQTLTINFDFLAEGNFELQLIQDGKNDTSFDTKTLSVKKGMKLEVPCLPRGGFAGTLSTK